MVRFKAMRGLLGLREIGRCAAGAGLALLLAGCGETRHPVEGQVRYVGGEPLASGDVTYYPIIDGKTPSDRILFGAIRSDGTYALDLDGVTGAPDGEYRVTVSASTDQRPASMPANPMNYYPLVDSTYGDPESTPLRITVAAGSQPGDYDLEVPPAM